MRSGDSTCFLSRLAHGRLVFRVRDHNQCHSRNATWGKDWFLGLVTSVFALAGSVWSLRPRFSKPRLRSHRPAARRFGHLAAMLPRRCCWRFWLFECGNTERADAGSGGVVLSLFWLPCIAVVWMLISALDENPCRHTDTPSQTYCAARSVPGYRGNDIAR